MFSGRGRREDPPVVIQAVLAVRWLVLAALISLEALTPGSTPTRFALPLYGVALLYSAAFTLYAWRYPDRAGNAARWALLCDSGLIWIGMQVTTFPREFLLLGFPLAAAVGVLTGHLGATLLGILLALSQNPSAPASIFAPNQWLAWALMTFSLLATGNTGAAMFERLADRARFAHGLAEIKNIGTSPPHATDAAEAALDAAVALFRADSGSLMLFDPRTEQLEVLAARGLDDARIDESVAGWDAQGGHAVLLTPGSMLQFRLKRLEIGSSLCVPVAVGRTKLGVLNLNRATSVHQFTQVDLEAADLVAHQMAGLLMRAQHERTFPALVTELAEGHSKVSLALTRDPVVLWPVLLDVVRSLTAAQFAVLALEHEYTGTVEIVSARGIDGVSARDLLPSLLAATTRGEIHVSDGSGAPASLTCVPLRVSARTIGAVGLGLRTDKPYPHSLLRAIAAHIAAAVDTALTAHRIADIGATEERRRIAREMHDGLAQTLADALLQTDLATMTAQTSSASLVTEIKTLRTLLERAMREVREFMSTLRRGESHPDGLFPALEMLARELGRRRTDPPATVVCTGDDAHVPPAVWHAVLAIVRQALINAHAHAQATTVTIRAEATDGRCAVSIADDGRGFDLQAYRASAPPGHHLGLASMEERAALVGGRLEIDTAPNRGTTVTVDIGFGRNDG